VTKQDAVRAVDDAQSVDELRAVLLAIVDKLPWTIETSSAGYRAPERGGARAK
jgi:hypothetical protein